MSIFHNGTILPNHKPRNSRLYLIHDPKEHEGKTQAEMAELWEGDVSSRTISQALQKLGLTRKKRPTGIPNGMKRNAQSSAIS